MSDADFSRDELIAVWELQGKPDIPRGVWPCPYCIHSYNVRGWKEGWYGSCRVASTSICTVDINQAWEPSSEFILHGLVDVERWTR